MGMHEEFAAAMAGLGVPGEDWNRGLAVAVSGGADSTALALLSSRWAAERGTRILALVCDHGLRAESRREMDETLSRLRGLGIESMPLVLRLPPGPAIQERARDARYSAMLSAMRRQGIGVLAIGHHLHDQAETVAHRLATPGTPVEALAGMRPCRVEDDALLVRPLLGFGRGSLRDFLREEGVGWIEDPSNENDNFTRVRIRKALRADPAEFDRMIGIAEHSAALRDTIERDAALRLEDSVVGRTPWGAALLDPARMGDDPAGTSAMRRIIHGASGHYPEGASPRRIAALIENGGTLAGVMAWREGGLLWVSREAAAQATPSPARSFAAWDGRIRFGSEVPSGLVVSPLGDEEATRIKRRTRIAMPHRVLSVAPAVRDRHMRLVSLPQLGMGMPMDWRVAVRDPVVPLVPGQEPPARPGVLKR